MTPDLEILDRQACSVTDAGNSNLTVADAARRFLAHCRVARGLSAHTLRAYKSDLADFATLAGPDARLAEVTRDAVRQYARVLLEDRNLKTSTVRRRMATLKVLFRWLEREEFVLLSVFHRLDLSIRMPQRLPRALETEHMRRLLRASESATRSRYSDISYATLLMHFVVVTLFTTGLRIGELIGVRLDDIHLPDGAIHVRGKGNRERRVYLAGPEAIAVLRRFLAARHRVSTTLDNLLVTAAGRRVTSNKVRHQLHVLAIRAGIARRVTPHMLRHTAATQLLEAGVEIRFVQRLLGHASIATTQIYTQVRDVALKKKLTRANTLLRLSRRA